MGLNLSVRSSAILAAAVYAAATTLGAGSGGAAVDGRPDTRTVPTNRDRPVAQSQPTTRPAFVLPPPPEGVTHLDLADVFKNPWGPRGAEYTDRARSLDGKRVRMVGYMVKPAHKLDDHAGHGHSHAHDCDAAGKPERWFMFCPVPVTINDAEFGLADDLPLSTVFVRLAESDRGSADYRPGPFVLTGLLRLGRFEQPDKRVAWLRLDLETPLELDSPATAPAGNAKSTQGGHHEHAPGGACDHKSEDTKRD